jgi:hypothetical protein
VSGEVDHPPAWTATGATAATKCVWSGLLDQSLRRGWSGRRILPARIFSLSAHTRSTPFASQEGVRGGCTLTAGPRLPVRQRGQLLVRATAQRRVRRKLGFSQDDSVAAPSDGRDSPIVGRGSDGHANQPYHVAAIGGPRSRRPKSARCWQRRVHAASPPGAVTPKVSTVYNGSWRCLASLPSGPTSWRASSTRLHQDALRSSDRTSLAPG